MDFVHAFCGCCWTIATSMHATCLENSASLLLAVEGTIRSRAGGVGSVRVGGWGGMGSNAKEEPYFAECANALIGSRFERRCTYSNGFAHSA